MCRFIAATFLPFRICMFCICCYSGVLECHRFIDQIVIRCSAFERIISGEKCHLRCCFHYLIFLEISLHEIFEDNRDRDNLLEMTPSAVGYTVMRGEKVAKKSFQTNR